MSINDYKAKVQTLISQQQPSAGSGFSAYKSQVLSIINNPKPTSTPVAAKPVASKSVISKPATQPNFLQQAENVVRNITKGLSLTFTAPKVSPPLSKQAVSTLMPKQPKIQAPVAIKPNQTKLTPEQMQQANIINTQQAKLVPAKKPTIWQQIGDKIGSLFDSPESIKARASNAVAMQKLVKQQTGKTLPLDKLAEKGGNPLKNTLMEDLTKQLGIRNTATTSELGQGIFTTVAAIGLVEAPVATLTALGLFTGVNELKSGLISAVKGKGFKLGANQTFSDLFENAPADVKNTLDIIDFLTTAKITHGIYKTSPKVFDLLTKDTIEKVGGPKTIAIPAAKVREINLGKPSYEADLVKSLGLDSTQWRKAVKEGLTVDVSSEKFVKIVDKPYWAKIKSIVGAAPTNIETVVPGQSTSKTGAIAGYLPDGQTTPQEIVSSILKNGQENTPEGKAIIKAATEAQQRGQDIVVNKTPEPVAEPKAPVAKDIIPQASKATNYTSAADFAIETYAAKPSNQIGLVDPKTITIRDNVDTTSPQYTALKADIQKNGIQEPIRVTVENGKAITTEGSQRTNIAQELGIKVPVIVNKGEIKGLPTIEEIYKREGKVVPQAKETKPITLKSTDELVKHINRQGDRTPEQIATLRKSIQENGITYPIELIIRKDGSIEINDGTHRLQIAKDLGIKEVPVKILKDERVKVKPRTVSVPREQLPVGAGKEKVSRLEARMRSTLDKIDEKTIEKLGLSTYKEMNKKEAIQSAAEYVLKNPEEALRVLKGEVDVPKGLVKNAIYIAMQNEAVGDVNLARKLASLESTRLGQEISILSEADKDSPVSIMREIIKVKEAKIEKQYSKKTVNDVVQKFKKKGADVVEKSVKSKKEYIDKNDWGSLIDEIRCK